jgi:GH25 family lysozyme M1 (1,4-beta-N-acetylmuramidase)
MEIATIRAHGIDISKYDGYFLPENATGRLDFVIQRASYGTVRDEEFERLQTGVQRIGIRGAYHYLSSHLNWQLQADAFINYTGNRGFHFFACDFEGAFNNLSVNFAKMAWDWIMYVKQMTNLPVLLYTSPSLYTSYITPSQSQFGIDWNTVPLWTAQWFFTPNPNGIPTMPLGRTTGWKLWQYTDKGEGRLYGVKRLTVCDLNVYNGTVEEMRTYFNVIINGDKMYLELKSNTDNEYRSIRATHSVSHIQGVKIGQINVGGIAKAYIGKSYKYLTPVVFNGTVVAQAGDIWHRVYEANGVPIDGWCAEIHLGKRYLNVKQISDSGSSHPLPTLIITIDGGDNYNNVIVELKPK